MKRLRLANEVETEGFNVANVLMLLSHGQADADNQRVFECQTCNRRFSSFQALGGHRASHKKPKLSSSSSSNEDDHNNQSTIKPKVHECSICGIEFATGQALGGHMRRHRATINGEGFAEKKKPNHSGKRVLLLDLNFPPLDDEVDYGRLRIGLGVVNSMVDYCFL